MSPLGIFSLHALQPALAEGEGSMIHLAGILTFTKQQGGKKKEDFCVRVNCLLNAVMAYTMRATLKEGQLTVA